MGRLGSGGWSGIGGVRVGVGGDGIGFEGFQVRGLWAGRSKELGVGVEGVEVEVEGVWVEGSSWNQGGR